MLELSRLDFYISTVIADPSLEKIQKAEQRFKKIIEEIKTDEQFKDITFSMPRTKNHYKEEDIVSATQIQWFGSASPEIINEFIKRWRQVDTNPLSIFYFHFLFNAF